MILDNRLSLASGMSIGTASRDFAGCKTSTNMISMNSLRDFGRGGSVFLCITVKTDFTETSLSSFGLSLCAEHLSDIGTITGVGTALPATGLLYHRLQPRLAFSGYIPGNLAPTSKNAVAGKKFLLPVSPITHFSEHAFNGRFRSTGNAYFMFEEIAGADPTFAPASNIITGSIDVDIVTLAESGAGPGFNDQLCYPSGITVR